MCRVTYIVAICVMLWVPTASGQQISSTTGTAQPLAGPTVAVKMIDAVDSSSGPAGKQYRAGLIRPVNIGNGVIIAQGSAATVTLVKNASGWGVQLSSLVINGQVVPVTSNSGSVVGAAAQSAAADAANAMNAMLGKFGRKPGFPAVAAVATGERVILTPGISLSFVLNAIPSSNAATPGAGAPNPTGAGQPALVPGTPLSANVKETLLGPSKPAGWFVVSPDGGHMAISSMHGSREIVILDGVDGPDFDHAAHLNGVQAIDVVFSPDGKRSVYLAQHGDNLVAVVDGKEAYTVETVTATRGAGLPGIDQSHVHDTGDKLVQHQFLISQSGAHIVCVTQDTLWHVFLDGAKSPDYREVDLRQVAFVGENLVYAALTGDQKWHMVVNHKPGPAYDSVTSLELSDDNQHYAFIGTNASNSVVVADGVPGTPRPGGGLGIHGLVIASNGRVAYLGYTLNGRGDPSSESLFVGDQQVSPETSPFTGTFKTGVERSDVKVVFSPDGKKFAYAKPVPGGIAAIIDGKQSIAYDGIGLMQFSPDSRRAFFVGNKNAMGNFAVIDGQEMAGQHLVKNLVFSPDGSRFGYEAYDGQLGFSMVVDGKQSGKFWNLTEKSLSFSSDGKHSVYAACTQYGKCQVIEDGTTTNVSGLYTFQTRMPPRIVFPPFFFSPDNTRLVYAYPKSDGTAIVINGQEIAHGPNFTYRCFSPDSKHFAAGTWTGKGYGVLVDGKVGPTYDDIVEANANANIFRFEDARTLRFLGVRGGSVYRVTMDVGSAP